jgi:hypothetical protein
MKIILLCEINRLSVEDLARKIGGENSNAGLLLLEHARIQVDIDRDMAAHELLSRGIIRSGHA